LTDLDQCSLGKEDGCVVYSDEVEFTSKCEKEPRRVLDLPIGVRKADTLQSYIVVKHDSYDTELKIINGTTAESSFGRYSCDKIRPFIASLVCSN
jgi:hypothetical protein